jgi:SAM-dependent methyltransferase
MTRLPGPLSCGCQRAPHFDGRMSPIHPVASEGFSRGAVAYARGRPDYPVALLSWLRTALLLSENSIAADLGAGTGKFTGLLMQTAAEVVAVEPVDAMRAQLIRAFPNVRAVAGTAEATTLVTGSVNAVACAQAFHWFPTREALQEIHRVLAPRGVLGLIWNVRDESCNWVAELTALIAPYEADTPRFHTGLWRRAFTPAFFSAPELTVFPHQHIGTAQEVIIDRTLSVSFIAALPPIEKAVVARKLNALIDTHPDIKGRKEITFPYRTYAYRCVRI